MTYSQCSKPVQRLLKRMREVGWGEITDLQICKGVPVLESPRQITRDIALDRPYTSVPYSAEEKLKPSVLNLLRQFEEVHNGTIPFIRIQDGLPIRLKVKETL